MTNSLFKNPILILQTIIYSFLLISCGGGGGENSTLEVADASPRIKHESKETLEPSGEVRSTDDASPKIKHESKETLELIGEVISIDTEFFLQQRRYYNSKYDSEQECHEANASINAESCYQVLELYPDGSAALRADQIYLGSYLVKGGVIELNLDDGTQLKFNSSENYETLIGSNSQPWKAAYYYNRVSIAEYLKKERVYRKVDLKSAQECPSSLDMENCYDTLTLHPDGTALFVIGGDVEVANYVVDNKRIAMTLKSNRIIEFDLSDDYEWLVDTSNPSVWNLALKDVELKPSDFFSEKRIYSFNYSAKQKILYPQVTENCCQTLTLNSDRTASIVFDDIIEDATYSISGSQIVVKLKSGKELTFRLSEDYETLIGYPYLEIWNLAENNSQLTIAEFLSQQRIFFSSDYKKIRECFARMNGDFLVNCYQEVKFLPDGTATITFDDIINLATYSVKDNIINLTWGAGRKIEFRLTYDYQLLIDSSNSQVWYYSFP